MKEARWFESPFPQWWEKVLWLVLVAAVVGLAAALSGCGPTTPADAIRVRGGVEPIICYRKDLNVCRDGVGAFWICDTAAYPTCMRAEEPSKVFSLPEQPGGAR